MRKVPLVVGAAVFVLTLIGSYVYVKSLPDTYAAETVVQFSPRTGENGIIPSGDVVSSAASGYVAYLGAPSTLAAVAPKLGVTPEELRSAVTVTLIPATTTVTIDYESEDPEVSALGADAMADAVVKRSKGDPLVSATILASAAIPEEPSGPARTLILAAGFMLAVLLGFLAALAVNLLLDRRPAKEAADEQR